MEQLLRAGSPFFFILVLRVHNRAASTVARFFAPEQSTPKRSACELVVGTTWLIHALRHQLTPIANVFYVARFDCLPMFRFVTVVLILAICPTSAAKARLPSLGPGSLDPRFGTGGQVVTDFGPTHDVAHALAIQIDGKIVAVGDTGSDFAIARYERDGSLDTSFGDSGTRIIDLGGSELLADVAVQSDGSILATGYSISDGNSDVVLTKFLENGQFDGAFGSNGVVVTDVSVLDRPQALAVQSDGKIVVGGWTITAADLNISSANFMLLRYKPNGVLDTSFGADGIVVTDFFGARDQAYDLALDEDENILAVGIAQGVGISDFAVARYKSDGTLDATFGNGGRVTTDLSGSSDRADAIAIQEDGKILVGGDADSGGSEVNMGLVRYNIDGTLDLSFSGDGKVTTDIADRDFLRALLIDENQNIYAAGFSEKGTVASRTFALSRHLPSGALDTTFDFDGIVETDFFGEGDVILDLAQQDARTIVAGGLTRTGGVGDFAFARYLTIPEPSTLTITLLAAILFASSKRIVAAT